jgi:hypothetical protein
MHSLKEIVPYAYSGICPIVEYKDRKLVKLLQLNLNIHKNPAERVLLSAKAE